MFFEDNELKWKLLNESTHVFLTTSNSLFSHREQQEDGSRKPEIT